ncbi:MAG: hypothetical protein DCC55_18815 [Chloroflexi bacterium]|nr:MAG: hypothetical protein DCC55_18815 [Chloroflexota bacterium]
MHRRPRIPVTLTLSAQPPPQAESDAMLMAVDSLVGQAGRTGVVQVLNGSHGQKLQQRGWGRLPE